MGKFEELIISSDSKAKQRSKNTKTKNTQHVSEAPCLNLLLSVHRIIFYYKLFLGAIQLRASGNVRLEDFNKFEGRTGSNYERLHISLASLPATHSDFPGVL